MRPTLLAVLVLLVLAGPAAAISGGEPSVEDTPWLATFSRGGVACGGALIAPDRVLTAAHCVSGVDPDRLVLRVGSGNYRQRPKRAWRGAFLPQAYRLVPSPEVPGDPAASASRDDIAIVLLERPVEDVAPLPLAGGAPAAGEPTLTIGRGYTRPGARGGRPSDIPRVAAQAVVPSSTCDDAYGTLLVPDDHLCTEAVAPSKAQACQGDSGSPVLVRRGGVLAAVGVVTWGGETQGRACGEGLPDVAERVLPHLGQLLGAAPKRLSPVADRRVRVRRSGATRTCVIGSWTPSGARFRVRWWRAARPSGSPFRRQVPVSGATGRTLTRPAGSPPVGCTVTATTAGGVAVEESYNRR